PKSPLEFKINSGSSGEPSQVLLLGVLRSSGASKEMNECLLVRNFGNEIWADLTNLTECKVSHVQTYADLIKLNQICWWTPDSTRLNQICCWTQLNSTRLNHALTNFASELTPTLISFDK